MRNDSIFTKVKKWFIDNVAPSVLSALFIAAITSPFLINSWPVVWSFVQAYPLESLTYSLMVFALGVLIGVLVSELVVLAAHRKAKKQRWARMKEQYLALDVHDKVLIEKAYRNGSVVLAEQTLKDNAETAIGKTFCYGSPVYNDRVKWTLRDDARKFFDKNKELLHDAYLPDSRLWKYTPPPGVRSKCSLFNADDSGYGGLYKRKDDEGKTATVEKTINVKIPRPRKDGG